jgi:hypothetical protein
VGAVPESTVAAAGPARHAALRDTPIFDQTAATRGRPGITGTFAPPIAAPAGAGNDGVSDPTAWYEFTDAYPATMPAGAAWEPAAADAPGIFFDPAGRRRIRMRRLALAAGAVLAGFLVVAAVGLLGGPKAPLLPWPSPAGQPGSGAAHGSQRQEAPGNRPVPSRSAASAARRAAGETPTHSPGTSASQRASTPARSGTSASASSSQHTPPGIARKPSTSPARSHPAAQ